MAISANTIWSSIVNRASFAGSLPAFIMKKIILAIKTGDWLFFVEPILTPLLRIDYRLYNRYVSWRRSRYHEMLNQTTVELLPLFEKNGYDTTAIRASLSIGASETAYRLSKRIVDEIKVKAGR
jgi:hypothetical protein